MGRWPGRLIPVSELTIPCLSTSFLSVIIVILPELCLISGKRERHALWNWIPLWERECVMWVGLPKNSHRGRAIVGLVLMGKDTYNASLPLRISESSDFQACFLDALNWILYHRLHSPEALRKRKFPVFWNAFFRSPVDFFEKRPPSLSFLEPRKSFA